MQIAKFKYPIFSSLSIYKRIYQSNFKLQYFLASHELGKQLLSINNFQATFYYSNSKAFELLA